MVHLWHLAELNQCDTGYGIPIRGYQHKRTGQEVGAVDSPEKAYHAGLLLMNSPVLTIGEAQIHAVSENGCNSLQGSSGSWVSLPAPVQIPQVAGTDPSAHWWRLLASTIDLGAYSVQILYKKLHRALLWDSRHPAGLVENTAVGSRSSAGLV